jgi:hypothetical protein
MIDQTVSGEAIAESAQDSDVVQGDDTVGTHPEPPETEEPGGILDGDLLNVDVDVALDADLAAPIAGAVAANANVAAPIDAAVAANIASIGSDATAVAQQDAIITQNLDDVTAHASTDQSANVEQ